MQLPCHITTHTGGTIDFPESRWEEWYAKWVSCSDGSRYYGYLKDGDTFVGEAAYHLEGGRWLADILIYAPQRGKGYGREALSLLIEKAAENGIEELFDSIAADNVAAISLFSSLGFETVKKDSETVLVRKRIFCKYDRHIRAGASRKSISPAGRK